MSPLTSRKPLQSIKPIILPLLTWTLLGLSRGVCAQEIRVEVQTQQPPFYVGEPVVIQFTVVGFDDQGEPTCTMEAKPGQDDPNLRGEKGSINRSVSSREFQYHGRFYRETRVTYVIRYLITAKKPGKYQVGPFLLKQGQKEKRVESFPMSFQEVPLDPEMRVRLILPEKQVYLHQRVPVTIEWWYAGNLRNLRNLNLQSPLFDQFRFAPDQPPQPEMPELPIQTKNGSLDLLATARKEQFEGRNYVVLSAKRVLIPDHVGEFSLQPVTATVSKLTREGRPPSPLDDLDGFFGPSMLRPRRRVQSELIRARGKSQTLVVKALPNGQPESFAGAVGRGFAIEVAADRTVVRVGDPIGLDITLRGDGNLETASLPPLSADGGMHPELFGLPQGELTGEYADGVKQFHVSVRVADEKVGEIPALAYSWFDPETETYHTARSQPIALRVMPAELVTARQVVSGRSSKSRSEKPTAAEAAVADGPPDSPFSLTGADLAIEPHGGVLVDARSLLANSPATPAVIYASGLLLVAVAWLDRRRRSVDPVLAARGQTLRQQRARLARAKGLPKREAAEEVAAALRILIAEVPQVDRAAAQSVIAECEAITYSPDAGSDSQLDETLIHRAQEIMEVS